MRSPLISFEMLGSMDTYEAILRKSSAPNVFTEQRPRLDVELGLTRLRPVASRWFLDTQRS